MPSFVFTKTLTFAFKPLEVDSILSKIIFLLLGSPSSVIERTSIFLTSPKLYASNGVNYTQDYKYPCELQSSVIQKEDLTGQFPIKWLLLPFSGARQE